MKRFYQIIYLLAMFILPALAQERQPSSLLDLAADTVYVPLDSLKKPYQLPHRFIVPNSEKLHIKTFQLFRGIHYQIDYPGGKVSLLQNLPPADSVRIIYKTYPFPILSNYYHWQLRPPSADSAKTDTNVVAKAYRADFLDELESYQANLQKSGSIVRGIEIGSNRDLSLNSGLNLQLSGQIAPNVEILAALTDESTPIQPEGNTQNLREIDKVFIKLSSPHFGGTLGDFNLQLEQSEFGDVQRKLQGIIGEHHTGNYRQEIIYGTSRGFFHSVRLLGKEGNQGPYLLTGRNGEREIIVLAGTERVYVDGILQTRGENNDYVIDYGLAQITFTNKKLITSENRIEVDFEYTSAFQRYSRTLIGAVTTGKPLHQKLQYEARIFREWDDTNNLLEDDTPLSDEEKAVLATAGDNPLAAAVSGVDTVGSGRGNYVFADTLINGQMRQYLKYVGERNGDLIVRFTGVGSGNGDYQRVSLQNYRFVGPGKGSYLPIRLVPLAARKQFANIAMQWQATRQLSLKSEIAVSDFDQNVFSDVADADNRGGAIQLTGAFKDSTVTLWGKDLGRLEFSLHWLNRDSAFAPLDRAIRPEYAYKWNLSQNLLTTRENSFELNGQYHPYRWLRFRGNFGDITKGSSVNARRWLAETRITGLRLAPEVGFSTETVTSDATNFNSSWQRSSLQISKPNRTIVPLYRYQRENRTVDRQNNSVRTGFRFDDHSVKLSAPELLGINWEALTQFRVDYLYDPTVYDLTRKQAETQTYSLKGRFSGRKSLQGEFGFTYREKDFTPFFQDLSRDSIALFQTDAQFQDTTWQDRQSHLANLQLQYRNKAGTLSAQWDYQLASELQAIREIRYIEVEDNRGNFRFDSTLNEYVPDPQGDFLRFFFQTGDFRSVIRLETGLQVTYRPPANAKPTSGWANLLNKTTVQSYIKIEEQSQPPNIWDIYLLNLSKFHNLQTSLRGVYLLNQDLIYNERNPEWGVLIRSRYRDNLSNQFLDANDNERRIVWERSVETRRRIFSRKVNVTVGYQNGLQKRIVAALPTRNLNILQHLFSSGINWRPSIRWQLQLKAEHGIENDRNNATPLGVRYWEVKPQLAFSMRSKSRASLDVSYLTVAESNNPANRPLPFEMARGKKVGSSWLWNFRFDYFINQNVTVNVSYSGRKDAGAARTIHLGKAEVRAFF